jgi:hypothetical protein
LFFVEGKNFSFGVDLYPYRIGQLWNLNLHSTFHGFFFEDKPKETAVLSISHDQDGFFTACNPFGPLQPNSFVVRIDGKKVSKFHGLSAKRLQR